MEQVKNARDSVFDDVCLTTGVPEYSDIKLVHLFAKCSVTKEKLASWLETVCHILDQFAIPWLDKAAPLSEDVVTLKNDKISDQRKIISLQGQLIKKHEDSDMSVQSVAQTTMENEMKTYASAVSKSCSSALTPKKIEAAVQKVAEKEERSRNVIVYGLEETIQEDVQEKVQTILGDIDEKPLISDCCRIGIQKAGATRPVRFTMSSSDPLLKLSETRESYVRKKGTGLCTLHLIGVLRSEKLSRSLSKRSS